MTQPSLLDAPDARVKVCKRVPGTSRAQFAEAQRSGALRKREADVLARLERYAADCQCWRDDPWPTTAELAGPQSSTDARLYIRRGMSDLQAHGLVESVQRLEPCRVTRRHCLAWRVRTR